MAIILESCYAKKVGLPGYSSHSFSVTIRTEIADLSQVDRESAKLYALLQASVDREIQEVGFCPEANGKESRPSVTKGNPIEDDHWNCSDKQRELILRIVEEHRLEKREVETLAKELAEVGQFRPDRDGIAVAAVGRQPEFLAIVGFDDDRHNWHPFN